MSHSAPSQHNSTNKNPQPGDPLRALSQVHYSWGPDNGIHDPDGFDERMGIYFDSRGNTKMHIYCNSGFFDGVVGLIRTAAYTNFLDARNRYGYTGLHLAVLGGFHQIIRILLAAGARPIEFDRLGHMPLHLACIKGHLECVKALTAPVSVDELEKARMLIGRQVRPCRKSDQMLQDLEIATHDGERCIHLAAQCGQVEVLKYLIVCGANLNSRTDERGLTVLHIAVEMRLHNVLHFLLKYCPAIDLEATTEHGTTAYQCACYVGCEQSKFLLQQRGAVPLMPDADLPAAVALGELPEMIRVGDRDSGLEESSESSESNFSDNDDLVL